MIDGIATVWLPVSDMDRALQFYSETLGMDIEQHQEEWSMVTAGSVSIGLNGREEETPGGEGGAIIAFRPSEDIDTAVESLSAEGVEIAGGVTEHPWGKVATFRDPDGNELQLYEPPDE